MAITFVALSDMGDANHPSGFTNPTKASLTSPFNIGQLDVTIAASGVANSDAAAGLTALLAALKAYAEGALSTAMKLDSSATINGNIYLKTTPTRAVDGATVYNTGTDEYTCRVYVEWE